MKRLLTLTAGLLTMLVFAVSAQAGGMYFNDWGEEYGYPGTLVENVHTSGGLGDDGPWNLTATSPAHGVLAASWQNYGPYISYTVCGGEQNTCAPTQSESRYSALVKSVSEHVLTVLTAWRIEGGLRITEVAHPAGAAERESLRLEGYPPGHYIITLTQDWLETPGSLGSLSAAVTVG